jgi:hypothetical protein
MKNVISFSLYGSNPLYTLGAIENVKLAPIIYPGWYVYIFANNIPTNIRAELKKYPHCKIIDIVSKYDYKEIIAKCTFWRYYPLYDPSIGYCIYRDCDSRLNMKEKYAVDEWIASGKDYHLIYDHPQHTTEVMGGMWGSKGGIIPNIKTLLYKYFKKNDIYYKYSRRCDQLFLKHVIYPTFIYKSYIAHGNEKWCQYHINKGIVITPFPSPMMTSPLSGNNELNNQEENKNNDNELNNITISNTVIEDYIGKCVLVPGARKKPPVNL